MNNSLRQEYLEILGIQSWQLRNSLDEQGEYVLPVSSVTPVLDLQGKQVDTSLSSEPTYDNLSHPISDSIAPAVAETISPPASDSHIKPDLPDSIDDAEVLLELDNNSHKSNAHNNDVDNSNVYNTNVYISNEQIELKPEQEQKIAEPDIPVTGKEVFQQDAQLVSAIETCHLCSERKGRLNALSGQGSANASVFIISDSPSAEEDRDGHYLIGQNQQLFNVMLNTIGLTDNYFLTGIVKCFSMDQYLVSDEEAQSCSGFLHQQIQDIKPSVIVLFGVAQAQFILKTRESFNQLRNKTHRIIINGNEYPVVVTYHPAFLIRNPLFKKEALADLIRIKSLSA